MLLSAAKDNWPSELAKKGSSLAALRLPAVCCWDCDLLVRAVWFPLLLRFICDLPLL